MLRSPECTPDVVCVMPDKLIVVDSVVNTPALADILFVDDIWPGSKVSADYLTDNPQICKEKKVLELLGTGCGLPVFLLLLRV